MESDHAVISGVRAGDRREIGVIRAPRVRLRGRGPVQVPGLTAARVALVTIIIVMCPLTRRGTLPVPIVAWLVALGAAVLLQESARRAAPSGRRRVRRGNRLLVASTRGLAFHVTGSSRRDLPWDAVTSVELVPVVGWTFNASVSGIDVLVHNDRMTGAPWRIRVQDELREAVDSARGMVQLNARSWLDDQRADVTSPLGDGDEETWAALRGCSALVDECLSCQYPRSGLPSDIPCPECGASAPGRGAPLLMARRVRRRGLASGKGVVALLLLLLLLATVVLMPAFGASAACCFLIGLVALPILFLSQLRGPASVSESWEFGREALVITPESARPVRIPWSSVVRVLPRRFPGAEAGLEVRVAPAPGRGGEYRGETLLARTAFPLGSAGEAEQVLRAMVLRVLAARAPSVAPREGGEAQHELDRLPVDPGE